MLAVIKISHRLPARADLIPAFEGKREGKLSRNCRSSQGVPALKMWKISKASTIRVVNVTRRHSPIKISSLFFRHS